MSIKIGDKFKIISAGVESGCTVGDIHTIESINKHNGFDTYIMQGGWRANMWNKSLILRGAGVVYAPCTDEDYLQEQLEKQKETIDSMQSQIHLMAKAIGANKKGIKEVNKIISQKDSSKGGTREVIEIDTVGEMSSLKYTKSNNWGNPSVEEMPELKTLGQDMFDGLDKKYVFAAVDDDGRGTASNYTLGCLEVVGCWANSHKTKVADMIDLGKGFDATDWQNSLIKRKSIGLKGSDLCRAMLSRGDKFVMCFTSNSNDARAEFHEYIRVVNGFNGDYFTRDNAPSSLSGSRYAVPIDNNGNILTQKDVGL